MLRLQDDLFDFLDFDFSASPPSSAGVEFPGPSFSLEGFSSAHIENEIILTGDHLLEKSSDESHLDGVWTEPIREFESTAITFCCLRRMPASGRPRP